MSLQRVFLFVSLGGVVTWTTIFGMKIILSFVFRSLLLPFPLLLLALPLVALGQLGIVLALLDALADVVGSADNIAFVARARLHRLISLAQSSFLAKCGGILMFLAPIGLWCMIFGISVLVLVTRECDAPCVFHRSGMVCLCRGPMCKSLCEWSALGLTALFCIAVQTVMAWRAARHAQQAQSRDTLAHEALFAQLDSDFSGSLAPSEVAQIMGVPLARAEQLVRAFDVNRDGMLDVGEFRELLATKRSPPQVPVAQKNGSVASMVVSPKVWATGMVALTRWMMITAVVPVLMSVSSGGSLDHIVSAVLSVVTLVTLFWVVMWMSIHVMGSFVELCLSTRTAQAVHVVLTTLVPAALVAATPAFQNVGTVLLFVVSTVTISGMWLREQQRRRGAREGSSALLYARYLVGGVFLGLFGLFLLSHAQVAMGLRHDLPDAFRVRTNGTHVTVHTEVGGVDVARGIVRVHPSLSSAPPVEKAFAPCSANVVGLGLVDAALLSQLAYLKCGSPDTKLFLSTFLPDFTFVGDDCRGGSKTSTSSVAFHHLRSTKRKVEVLAIRGTHVLDLIDWLEDVDIWVESVVFDLCSSLFPGLMAWPETLVSTTIHFLATHVDDAFGPRRQRYFEPVLEYLQRMTAPEDVGFVVVGHSLGGGLAKVVGASARVPAIALSGPGIVSNRHKFAISQGDINRFVTNIVPSHDVVAKLGTMGGTIHNIVCEAHRPDICHMPMFSVCKLHNMCYGASGSIIDTCVFSSIPQTSVSSEHHVNHSEL